MPTQYFALVDCNNFYASCERVFRPELIDKPIAVLSNNDGCIVARSDELKSIGVPNGVPYFKWKEKLAEHQAHIFSSNYALYGDFSQRVMDTLREFSQDIEPYSIDEAFLDVSHVPESQMVEFLRDMKCIIEQYTGIPISIGVGCTKTLAKVCNEYAKKEFRKAKSEGVPSKNNGVYVLRRGDDETRIDLLKRLDVGDIWGVGWQSTKMWKKDWVLSAYHFAELHPEVVRKKMSVMGLRTHQELNEVSCLELETVVEKCKGILTSRSFGKPISTLDQMEEAVAYYVSRAAEKLRKQNSMASYLSVFIQANRKGEKNRYYDSKGMPLALQTSYTPDLVSVAIKLVRRIFAVGFRYKKAGVMLGGIVDDTPTQESLFDLDSNQKKERLMKTVDTLNQKFGQNTLKVATQGTDQKWQMKSELRSPRYTTVWDEILHV
jgi:DNA polymerase V